MMAEGWNIALQARTPWATLELCRHTWPSPNRILLREEEPTLSFNLTGSSQGKSGAKSGRYRDSDDPAFFPMGDMMFQPAATELESYGEGGEQCFLRVSFHPQAFGEGLELAIDHADPEIQRRLLKVDAPSVLMLVRRTLSEMRAPGMASSFLLDGLTTMMAVELVRHLAGRAVADQPAHGGLAPWQLRRIEERIHDDAAMPPTVDELARLVRLSPRHLARAYRASKDCTLSETIEVARQARAERMVLDKALALKEIAHRLRFASPSSFSTAFRRRAGCSPQEFARRGRSAG
nr:AraC family transcriptional regulator [Azospirillum sp. 412522]